MKRTILGQGDSIDLRVVILVCDTPVDAVFETHGTYHDVFCELFEKSLKLCEPRKGKVEFLGFDVVHDEFPDEKVLKSAHGVLLTGSAASAYQPLPWIQATTKLVASLAKEHPHLRIIGICFGHQIVAQAFGSTVQKNEKGWELGVYTMDLNELGQRILSDNEEKTKTIEQVHQDHVLSIPEGFSNLATTTICPVHSLVKFYSPPSESASRTEILKQIHILTLQGHPEFTSDIVRAIIDVRETKGVLSRDFSAESRERAGLAHEGSTLGRTILEVLFASVE